MLSFFLQLSTPPWKTEDELLWSLPALPILGFVPGRTGAHREHKESNLFRETLCNGFSPLHATKDLWCPEVVEHAAKQMKIATYLNCKLLLCFPLYDLLGRQQMRNVRGRREAGKHYLHVAQEHLEQKEVKTINRAIGRSCTPEADAANFVTAGKSFLCPRATHFSVSPNTVCYGSLVKDHIKRFYYVFKNQLNKVLSSSKKFMAQP